MKNQRIESKAAFGDLGIYDGPPIEKCPTADRLRANAITGSQRLADRIAAVGLRP